MTSVCPCEFPLIESMAAAKRQGVPVHLGHVLCALGVVGELERPADCWCCGSCPCHFDEEAVA